MTTPGPGDALLVVDVQNDFLPGGALGVRGGPWPPHCVATTPGAQFAPSLLMPEDAVITSRWTDPRQEAYSASQGTALADHLRRRGVQRVFIGGLATDCRVRSTGADARVDRDFP